MDRKKKLITYAIIGAAFLVMSILKTCIHLKRRSALKDSVIVVAEIEGFEYTRGSTNVNVRYVYDGKVIDNGFGTDDLDSLKVKTKIRLRVSKEYPTEYIEYVGLVNQ